MEVHLISIQYSILINYHGTTINDTEYTFIYYVDPGKTYQENLEKVYSNHKEFMMYNFCSDRPIREFYEEFIKPKLNIVPLNDIQKLNHALGLSATAYAEYWNHANTSSPCTLISAYASETKLSPSREWFVDA
jgi:hypothetical protein